MSEIIRAKLIVISYCYQMALFCPINICTIIDREQKKEEINVQRGYNRLKRFTGEKADLRECPVNI